MRESKTLDYFLLTILALIWASAFFNIKIGELRSGCYSPHFGKVIGIAMMTKPYWNNSQTFKIELNGTSFDGKVCDLPFI